MLYVLPVVTSMVITPDVLRTTRVNVGGLVVSTPKHSWAVVPRPEPAFVVPEKTLVFDDEEAKPLASAPEVLAAAAVSTGMAMAVGFNLGSAVVVGAGMAWAAGTDASAGVGEVSRGLGTLGINVFDALRDIDFDAALLSAKSRVDDVGAKLDALRKKLDDDLDVLRTVTSPTLSKTAL